MVLGKDEHLVPGICGYVEDGILPACSVMKPGSLAWGSLCLVCRELRSGVL